MANYQIADALPGEGRLARSLHDGDGLVLNQVYTTRLSEKQGEVWGLYIEGSETWYPNSWFRNVSTE